jgi:serine-type D-Ala-D-Ala carboxypeptidase/endopeptidase (penicillin-binding protein 4)
VGRGEPVILFNNLVVFLFAIVVASSGWASYLNSFCHVAPATKTPIQGKSIDEKLPIASVSKLITSYWSLYELGKNYRYTTGIFYKKNNDSTYDVHIRGGKDPYLGKEFLHLIISELNRRGVKSVKRFTFDENFKFRWHINNKATAIGDYTPDSPTPDEVIKQFQLAKNLTKDYAKSAALGKTQGLTMLPTATMLVRSYKFESAADFDYAGFDNFILKSSPLHVLLKEMNRNSNNYAANLIFESVGGASKFKSFIFDRLKYTTDDIELFNGSGNRLDVDGTGNYNSARCSVILKILIDFESILKSQGLKLEDVVSVVGADNTSTSSTLYRNNVTENAVIAKTGTVSPAILLAGMISTKKGNVYFMYNMKTNGTRRDWRDAQRKIKQQVTVLIQNNYNGGVPIQYQSIKYFPFDKESDEEAIIEIP